MNQNDSQQKTDVDASASADRYPDDRSVLVRVKTTPAGLRRMADILERQGPGKSVRINWYTSQIEFVYCTDQNKCAISG